MKILKLQYILILAVLTACQDESFQVPMEENEVHIATENEILLKRGYSDYTLTAERLAGLEGCRIRTNVKLLKLCPAFREYLYLCFKDKIE